MLSDVVKYELLTWLESMPKHTKLCHGNFVPANIILNDKGTHIVDWVAARQGNASADVARTYLLLSPEGSEGGGDVSERFLPEDQYFQKNMCRNGCPSWPPPT